MITVEISQEQADIIHDHLFNGGELGYYRDELQRLKKMVAEKYKARIRLANLNVEQGVWEIELHDEKRSL